MEPRADFSADIRFRATVEGGRQTPAILRVYCPDASFPFDNRHLFGIHFFETDAVGAPGESVRVDVWVRSAPDRVREKITVGMAFTVCEGPRVVGDGIVVAVL
jgi:translation elongation factor EF-Tu-like GTPase